VCEILLADRAVHRVAAVQALCQRTVTPAAEGDFEGLEKLHGGIRRP
jgi:hypothetical protein